MLKSSPTSTVCLLLCYRPISEQARLGHCRKGVWVQLLMQLKVICELKREQFRSQIRKQDNQGKMQRLRSRLIGFLIQRVPAEYHIQFSLQEIRVNTKGHSQGNIQLMDNTIQAILDVIGQSRSDVSNFDESLFCLIRGVMNRVQRVPGMGGSPADNKMVQLLCLLVTYNLCVKHPVLEFDQVSFVSKMLWDSSNSGKCALDFLSKAAAVKDLEAKLFSNPELMLIITDNTKHAMQMNSAEDVSLLVAYWANFSFQGTALFRLGVIQVVYSLAFTVILSYQQFLYESTMEFNEQTLLGATVIITNILRHHAYLVDEPGFDPRCSQYIDILMIEKVRDSRELIVNIVSFLIQRSPELCLQVVQGTTFAQTLLNDLSPSNYQSRLKIFANILGQVGLQPELQVSIQNLATRLVSQTQPEIRESIWNVVTLWFLLKRKRRLTYIDRLILDICCRADLRYSEIQVKRWFWNQMADRGYQGITPPPNRDFGSV